MASREIPSKKPEHNSPYSQNDWVRSNQSKHQGEQRLRPQIPESSEPLAPQARRGNLFGIWARDVLNKSPTKSRDIPPPTPREDIPPPTPREDIPPPTPREDIPLPTSEQTKRLYQRWHSEDPQLTEQEVFQQSTQNYANTSDSPFRQEAQQPDPRQARTHYETPLQQSAPLPRAQPNPFFRQKAADRLEELRKKRQ